MDYPSLKDKGIQHGLITRGQASDIRANYNRFFVTPPLVTAGGDRIRGFTFTREDLEMAMYGTRQTNRTIAGREATEVHIALAFHDGDVVEGMEGFTTVLYGVDNMGLIEDGNDRIRDYSKPCPPDANCPQNAK